MSKPRRPVYITKEKLSASSGTENDELDPKELEEFAKRMRIAFSKGDPYPVMTTFIELVL